MLEGHEYIKQNVRKVREIESHLKAAKEITHKRLQEAT
jgi:hypothetical protein